MGKIKIYEIAKKLGLASKDVLEMAEKLKIEAKSHMSGVEEADAKRLEDSLKNKNTNASKAEDKKINNVDNKQDIKKTATKTSNKKEEKAPVIIRREVIIAEEENAKKEKDTQKIYRFADRDGCRRDSLLRRADFLYPLRRGKRALGVADGLSRPRPVRRSSRLAFGPAGGHRHGQSRIGFLSFEKEGRGKSGRRGSEVL